MCERYGTRENHLRLVASFSLRQLPQLRSVGRPPSSKPAAPVCRTDRTKFLSYWTFCKTNRDGADAHKAFEAIRRLTLRVERGNLSVPDEVTGVLYLSENVAKLAYNATFPVDAFDADSAEWVVANAHWIAHRVCDDAFRTKLWQVLAAIAPDEGVRTV